jgi:hypothetical protein
MCHSVCRKEITAARFRSLPQFGAQPLVNNRNVPSMEEWVSKIRSVWAKGGTNTLELARIVFRARQTLRYGVLGAHVVLQAASFRAIQGKHAGSHRRALGDLDGHTLGHLPNGLSILYCLAYLERRRLQRLIEEHVVHPELTLSRARELVAQSKGKQRAARRPSANKRVQRFAKIQRSLAGPQRSGPQPREFLAISFKEFVPTRNRRRSPQTHRNHEYSLVSIFFRCACVSRERADFAAGLAEFRTYRSRKRSAPPHLANRDRRSGGPDERQLVHRTRNRT